MTGHLEMAQGGEFDAIRRMLARWGELAVGIGDDAAILENDRSGRLVVSTDACVEGVHFERAWMSADSVASRATAAALSDLAAMGAVPEALLVSLIVPDDWRESIDQIADGIAVQVRESASITGNRLRIVGGNISRGDLFSLTSTVIGRAEKPAMRSGAMVGDLVVVTGVLGGPGAALSALKSGGRPDDWAMSRFLHPAPRFAEGILLSESGATAMIDISDGLAADARHIAAASGVRLAIEPHLVPRAAGVDAQSALSSGEEYEILACIPPAAFERIGERWHAALAPIAVVGRVEEREAGANDQAPQTIVGRSSPGHDHFRDLKREPLQKDS